MNKENFFLKIINETLSNNSFIGDDCAYLKDLNLLISQDTLVEGVHFLTSCFTPKEIGKKAVLVNISDILAGGGIPKYITISLSGKLDEIFIKNFYEGVNEICEKFKIKVIGGDLTGGEKITVSICIMGDAANLNISSRKNAKEGDFVYIAGFHGSSAKGLELLLKGERDKENEFIKAHIEPVLYPEISKTIASKAKYPYVMMDTSDGLFDALNKVSKASKKGFEIKYDKIPKKTDDKNLVLFGGEDFGLLICLNPKDSYIAEELNLQKAGIVNSSNKIVMDGEILDTDKSFNHFK